MDNSVSGKYKELSGWGRFPRLRAEIHEPEDSRAIAKRLARTSSLIPRGAGCSYGDSALANQVLSSLHLDNFIEFKPLRTSLTGSAGLSLGEILRFIVPHGTFLPVLPGTRHVSLGGAIAADIHGKNHHTDGSFCDHVESFKLQLASGEIVHCNRQENAELFAATCGGMGLTGMILEADLRLLRIENPWINSRCLAADSLESCLELLAEHADWRYSVAWIDCLSRGRNSGRSIIYLGDHAQAESTLKPWYESDCKLTVPFSTPSVLLNRLTLSAFNAIYYRRQRRRPERETLPYSSYFFPLDRLRHWNRLYGRKGFIQYQLLLPNDSALSGLTEILNRVATSGEGSFLSVLKRLGPGNGYPLSFPGEGATLTLDFKFSRSLMALLNELDRIVLDHQGKLYLAKDARMSQEMFRAGYPNWADFLRTKQQVDPGNIFSSLQSRRLGLTPPVS